MNVANLVTAALLAAATVAPAGAQQLQYTLTGSDYGGAPEYASFLIDVHPTILSNNYADGEGFRVKFIPGTFHYDVGPLYLSYLQDVSFASNSQGGGFFTLDPTDKTGELGTILVVFGDQLYTGPESSPTMLTGDFTVFDGFDGSPLSLVVSAVPEPATWAMLTFGFGAIGFALRRRAPVSTAVRFA